MTHLTNIYTVQVTESIEKTASLVLAQPFESARLMYAWAPGFDTKLRISTITDSRGQ